MFRKVLIANRGEIAVRVQRALRELGVRTVAVYSDVDAGAPHVTDADEAYLLGPAEPAASYLNQERLLEVARQAGCEAVHPGYGFLSENAAFARRCEDAGLVFIGPPAQAIACMGDKLRARELMSRAGVPVVPGSDIPGRDARPSGAPRSSARGSGAQRSDAQGKGVQGRSAPGHDGSAALAELERAAQAMRFPVLIKAAVGGGGKGMRVVHRAQDFQRAAEAARGEAENAFGNGTLYLEKYLERPRHVELQIFADAHGNTVQLFERECSIQRRHQKIVEEAPSAALTPRLRKRMGEAAVAAARAVGYRGAGTVEFLLDAQSHFYFLEMNTRLQVEHPVTEMVTGLDLVRLQIEVAAGHKLPPEALAPLLRGHALECRVYAEDPESGFLPMSGRILRVLAPGGPGVRVDGALRDGMQVPIHYDPLLAKVIAFGRDREESVRRMRRALAEFVILGIPTNLQFLQAIVESQAFRNAALSTDFIAEHLPDWRADTEPIPEAGVAALLLHDLVGGRAGATPTAGALPSPWETLTGWRHLAGERDGSS